MSQHEAEGREGSETQPRGRRRASTGVFLPSLALAAAVLVAGSAAFAWQAGAGPRGARVGTEPAEAEPRAIEVAQAPAAPAETPETMGFSAHARDAGLTACTGLYAELGQSLTGGSSYQLRSSWSEEAPETMPVQGLVGMTYETPGYSGQAAGYVYAAPDAGSCAGAMVRVAPFDMPCHEIPSQLPPASEPLETFEGVRIYALAAGGNVLLLPVASGCAMISTLALVGRPADNEG